MGEIRVGDDGGLILVGAFGAGAGLGSGVNTGAGMGTDGVGAGCCWQPATISDSTIVIVISAGFSSLFIGDTSLEHSLINLQSKPQRAPTTAMYSAVSVPLFHAKSSPPVPACTLIRIVPDVDALL